VLVSPGGGRSHLRRENSDRQDPSREREAQWKETCPR
jgi:hypothetical protein